MSALMLLGNAMSGLTAYAVGPTAPVNPDGTTPNGNKPQDTAYSEGTYINDTPLRLQVSKVKTAQGGMKALHRTIRMRNRPIPLPISFPAALTVPNRN